MLWFVVFVIVIVATVDASVGRIRSSVVSDVGEASVVSEGAAEVNVSVARN
jgi:hypothetical protein